MIRTGTHVLRKDSPNQFYPVFIRQASNSSAVFYSVGERYFGNDLSEINIPEYCDAIWPIRQNNDEGNWQISRENFLKLMEKGYIKLGKYRAENTTIYYLKKGEQKKVEDGLFPIIGHNPDGSIIVNEDSYIPNFVPGTAWQIPSHDASRNGSNLLNKIFGSKLFSFPKSLYAVHDTIRFFVANKPNALILDFFAGSGTTLHAVNLLNAEDGGHRRCIMVTNNEVSDEEAKKLKKDGFKPGDPEWERLGIAHYVTWPRTVCSIKGEDINGNPLKGTYLDSERAMADGFKANAAFFKLGFLDKNAVALGRQFKELLPVLWMKTGCVGLCPKLEEESLPSMLILPQNAFAVLIDEHTFPEFMAKVNDEDRIKQVFIVTDSTSGYREMISHLSIKKSYQLYRDYLDNFRINTGR
ncbi:DNA methyltransferase [Fannyhessea vaginae]|uniref:DNA methyltransferase n=1 Tax=Fannyhessea vaginae TaxID=82135 RepID=UPI003A806CA1